MLSHSINIPTTELKRVVVIGGGFGGIRFCEKLDTTQYQLVLVDRNNYHTFQPLLYQVATAGLEPSSIAGPLRKLFKKKRNFFFRMAEVKKVDLNQNRLLTNLGILDYDMLVIANGAKTSFFGHEQDFKGAFPLKQLGQALDLRNSILTAFESALLLQDNPNRQSFLNFTVVGGGPTGVEVAGALSELKNNVLPQDYPEIDFSKMKVMIIEGSPRLLNGMSGKSGTNALDALKKMGVEVMLSTLVNQYVDNQLYLSTGEIIGSHTLIWAAGVTGNAIAGLEKEVKLPQNRILTDRVNRLLNFENVFAIGDIALVTSDGFPNGHPQLAPVAIQQAINLAKNLNSKKPSDKWNPFVYTDKGSMATIGRNKAVVDLPGDLHFKGVMAWFVWMFVHLMSIIGFRNKMVVLINWAWNYFTYDRSIRLILKAKK